MTSINIPYGVLSNVTAITIGSTVTSICGYAFEIKNLRTFTIHAVTPPTSGSQMFNSATNVIIYVPAESVSAYQSASGWSGYAGRIQAIQE